MYMCSMYHVIITLFITIIYMLYTLIFNYVINIAFH